MFMVCGLILPGVSGEGLPARFRSTLSSIPPPDSPFGYCDVARTTAGGPPHARPCEIAPFSFRPELQPRQCQHGPAVGTVLRHPPATVHDHDRVAGLRAAIGAANRAAIGNHA